MTSKSNIYRKLVRLREKRSRLQKRITQLEQKLQGEKFRWGNCCYWRNRK